MGEMAMGMGMGESGRMLAMLKEEVNNLGKEVAKNAGYILELQKHQRIEGPSCTVNESLSKLKSLSSPSKQ